MNVLFVDFDGVVNTPMWEMRNDKPICRYGMPNDNKVNNYQAVQWLSEFCQKYDYKIVVTSTWRMDDNYKECLINGGLREGIEILGCTDILHTSRAEEIAKYLKEHKEIDNFIIVDDEPIGRKFSKHFILVRDDVGFNEREYMKCSNLHRALLMEKEK